MTAVTPDLLTDQSFYRQIRIGRKLINGRFVIPSGVRCTHAVTIERVFQEIAPIGIVTTKSISAMPRQGYREPIYAEVSPGCYINAVGLENPGAEAFRADLSRIRIPPDKFLLVSIFGGNAGEFVQAAHILEDLADGFELNLSCPHVKGQGIQIGQDPELVAEVTHAVASQTSLPVFVKLPVTCRDIGRTAWVAVDAGAAGITAINAVGPAMHLLAGQPVLSNVFGGLSGVGIRPLGLLAVKRVRTALGPRPLIIGLGGIARPEDVRDYCAVGADFYGIGSALTGMALDEMKQYFALLQEGLLAGNDWGQGLGAPGGDTRMTYHACRLAKRTFLSDDLFKLELEDLEGYFGKAACVGRFHFLCMPGLGEKPYAVFSQSERSFVVRIVGAFSRHLSQVPEGSTVYIRGPYGRSLPSFSGRRVVLVGGGTGIAPLYEIAREYRGRNELAFFLGARTSRDLFGLDKFGSLGKVHIATEDGSLGFKGLVTELLAAEMGDQAGEDATVFVNSGPEAMVLRCFEVQSRYASAANIWGSIPYRTSCGVGICGKCATPAGALSCVEGPFLRMEDIVKDYG